MKYLIFIFIIAISFLVAFYFYFDKEIDTTNTSISSEIIIENNKRKLSKYLIWEFLIWFKVNILPVIKIKNGLSNSIGCILKKYKSSHLFAPLTSTPITGTKISKIKKITNNGTTIFFNKLVSIAEIKSISKSANIVKIRCFEKKK